MMACAPFLNLSNMDAHTYYGFAMDFDKAADQLKDIVSRTPLSYNQALSKKYQCNVFLKREDLQVARSYKIRGAYNMMSSLSPEQLRQGVVCASAGNHAQGFAYSCKKLNARGVIFKCARRDIHAPYYAQPESAANQDVRRRFY